jgi:hypothetical protein
VGGCQGVLLSWRLPGRHRLDGGERAFYEGFVLVGAGLLVLLSVYVSTDGETAGLESAASGPIILTVIATTFLIDLTVYYIDTLDKPLRDLVVPELFYSVLMNS